jgi:hypothetical protein
VDHASIPALQDAIRHMHGVESRWIESVEVDETFEGAQVWKGEVQVFELVGHPAAKLCYAWSEASTGNKRRFFAALRVPPVDGAVAAVRASIVADAKKARN